MKKYEQDKYLQYRSSKIPVRIGGVPSSQNNREKGCKTESSVGLVFVQCQLRVKRDLQNELQEQLQFSPTCRRQEKGKKLERREGGRVNSNLIN